MTADQQRACAAAARRLLGWAWDQPRRDGPLIRNAIQCVTRTYGAEQDASRDLLRRAIGPQHLAEHGHEEGFILAEGLKHLIPIDPVFVRDVYVAFFAFTEQSKAASPLSYSRILPITSNRRQDYEMAQRMLAKAFPQFLESAPDIATQAVVGVLNGYVAQRHSHGRLEILRDDSFDLLGRHCRLVPDGSFVWDSSSVHDKDPAVTILGALERHLARVAESEEETTRSCLDALARENQTAVIWRRLLRAAARHPATLGAVVRELAWAHPLLISLDTATEAGAFIKAIFPLLAIHERELIETRIMALPLGVAADKQEWMAKRRDILLGCIPRDLLQGETARLRLTELESAGDVPSNEPTFRVEVGWGGSVSTEAWLEHSGTNTQEPRNRGILDLSHAVDECTFTREQVSAATEDADPSLAPMNALLAALHDAALNDVDLAVQQQGWGSLAEAAVRIAQRDVPCAGTLGRLALNTLLEAAATPASLPEPAVDDHFDEHPGWSTPAPRVTAAEGLMLLARHPDCISGTLQECIDRLSLDPVPAVRLQIAMRLWVLSTTDPEFMWQLAQRFASTEVSVGVLQFLVNQSLGRLSQLDAPRAIGLVTTVLSRFSSGPGVAQLRSNAFDILTAWWVWRAQIEARQALRTHVQEYPLNLPDAGHSCADLRRALVASSGPVDPGGDGVRERAIALFQGFLGAALCELRPFWTTRTPSDEWTEEEKERVTNLLQFIDLAARELYFASGIFDERNQDDGQDGRVTPAQRTRFFREAWPLFELIAEVGLASSTHHLLEMLEANVSNNPRDTFLLIARALQAGERGGYPYETIGQELFVRLVERYLGEYRQLFQSDDDCRRLLIAVLDIFVGAGWPSAQKLSYRLDDIFR